MSGVLPASSYRNLAEFRHQIRRFLRFSERAARAAGLEPRQHQLLLAVKGASEAGVTIRFLADRLEIRHHSAVGLVDRLVSHGLVIRHRGGTDRRQALVSLTPEGEAALEMLSVTNLAELRQNGPALVEALSALLKTQAEESNSG